MRTDDLPRLAFPRPPFLFIPDKDPRNDTEARRLASLFSQAAQDGYDPDLVAYELKAWAGYEVTDGIGLDDRALAVFCELAHPFPFETVYLKPAFWRTLLAFDCDRIEPNRENLQSSRQGILREGFAWDANGVKHPELLTTFRVGLHRHEDGTVSLGRNRLERARAASLALGLTLREGEEVNGLYDVAMTLYRALADTDTETFLATLKEAAGRLTETISQDILIELLFALLCAGIEHGPVDEKKGIYADLHISMSGGTRRVIFVSSLARAAETLDYAPGEQPAMLIECGD